MLRIRSEDGDTTVSLVQDATDGDDSSIALRAHWTDEEGKKHSDTLLWISEKYGVMLRSGIMKDNPIPTTLEDKDRQVFVS